MYYTRRWAFELCRQYFGITEAQAQTIVGTAGRHYLQHLWETDPAGFYEHPLAILRQEWWHQESGQYRHEGFWAAVRADALVLDYGCGTGEVVRPWVTHPAYTYRGETLLLETSAHCREYLAAKYPKRQHPTVYVYDASHWKDYAPETFDVLICTDVLEHIPDPMTVQRALWALLKPGGHALLKMEPAYPHPGHLADAVAQVPAWKQWVKDETEIIEIETYAWVRKPV